MGWYIPGHSHPSVGNHLGDSRYRKDGSFPVPGETPGAVWCIEVGPRTAAVIVLAGGLAITVYAYWLNHGS